MTSTPTACPKCGRLPDFCDHREIVATQLAEPRQPDMSAARDAATEILGYHGCASGDCPHEKQSECFAALVEAGYDAGHARALKEMGAKLESAEEGERFYRREWESACERVDYAQEQLAAAQSEIARLNTLDPAVIAYDTRSVRALTNLIKERDDLREQLAACELRAGEYEKALEDTIYDSERLEQGQYAVDKVKAALSKHRRGGES